MTDSPEKRPDPRELRKHAQELLTSRGWLAQCDPAFQERILRAGIMRSYKTGRTLYLMGDMPNGLFGIVEGSVTISVPADSGSEFIATRAESGFWIGDLALLSDKRRLVTVAAVADTTTLFVPSRQLLQIVDEDPRRYRDFYALTHANVALALRLMANLSVSGSERKLGLRLLQHEDLHGHEGAWMELSQDDLARMSALSPPTLQRTLRKLADKGLVEVGYARVRISDRTRLIEECRD